MPLNLPSRLPAVEILRSYPVIIQYAIADRGGFSENIGTHIEKYSGRAHDDVL